MSRELFQIEKGLRLSGENSDSSNVDLLFGTAAPGGDTGEQDAAAIGSIYIRQNGTSSTIYQKTASSNVAGDWQENGSSQASVGTFRGEKVRAVTSENVSAGVRDLAATPFTDDETPFLAAAGFTVGEFIISNSLGTPVLLEVTVVSAPNVTFAAPASAPALSEADTFIACNYLPDSPGDQEGLAIVNFNGSVIVKIGDIDWNFADGINLASGYAATGGDVSDADTVQSAIAKLDGNNDDQDTLLGTAQGATDLGTFSGTTISDANTAKGALQELETAHEEVETNVDDLITLSGMPENSQDLGTFTGTTISDSSTVKAAFQEMETFVEAEALAQVEIDGNVDDLITLSGMPENSTDLGSFSGDLFADGLNDKSALQRIEDLLDELKMKEVAAITTEASADEVQIGRAHV